MRILVAVGAEGAEGDAAHLLRLAAVHHTRARHQPREEHRAQRGCTAVFVKAVERHRQRNRVAGRLQQALAQLGRRRRELLSRVAVHPFARGQHSAPALLTPLEQRDEEIERRRSARAARVRPTHGVDDAKVALGGVDKRAAHRHHEVLIGGGDDGVNAPLAPRRRHLARDARRLNAVGVVHDVRYIQPRAELGHTCKVVARARRKARRCRQNAQHVLGAALAALNGGPHGCQLRAQFIAAQRQRHHVQLQPKHRHALDARLLVDARPHHAPRPWPRAHERQQHLRHCHARRQRQHQRVAHLLVPRRAQRVSRHVRRELRHQAAARRFGLLGGDVAAAAHAVRQPKVPPRDRRRGHARLALPDARIGVEIVRVHRREVGHERLR
mmetsp:Transcript_3857/g.12049  ORF Transcript_3857/g.12049 Transcript_3857/m.12049 type:complete len:384 (-) Transcript_3857:139-1290(-)